ncbi:hypothetical protein PR048_014507 [Dryococelus australis]|uniref:Uncharacterized protein n=1 Tax=Dryococelus australis TaxID=614101 RepID=A0ABQ9HEL1_9NEOP|nr:hypothetical protein PR048_014507 [Dryococelus australis]
MFPDLTVKLELLQPRWGPPTKAPANLLCVAAGVGVIFSQIQQECTLTLQIHEYNCNNVKVSRDGCGALITTSVAMLAVTGCARTRAGEAFHECPVIRVTAVEALNTLAKFVSPRHSVCISLQYRELVRIFAAARLRKTWDVHHEYGNCSTCKKWNLSTPPRGEASLGRTGLRKVPLMPVGGVCPQSLRVSFKAAVVTMKLVSCFCGVSFCGVMQTNLYRQCFYGQLPVPKLQNLPTLAFPIYIDAFSVLVIKLPIRTNSAANVSNTAVTVERNTHNYHYNYKRLRFSLQIYPISILLPCRVRPSQRGRGDAAARMLASQQGEAGSNPDGIAPGFSHVGIVPGDATGRRVFSGISSFPRRPNILPLKARDRNVIQPDLDETRERATGVCTCKEGVLPTRTRHARARAGVTAQPVWATRPCDASCDACGHVWMTCDRPRSVCVHEHSSGMAPATLKMSRTQTLHSSHSPTQKSRTVRSGEREGHDSSCRSSFPLRPIYRFGNLLLGKEFADIAMELGRSTVQLVDNVCTVCLELRHESKFLHVQINVPCNGFFAEGAVNFTFRDGTKYIEFRRVTVTLNDATRVFCTPDSDIVYVHCATKTKFRCIAEHKGCVKYAVSVSPLPVDLADMRARIITYIDCIDRNMLHRVWEAFD